MQKFLFYFLSIFAFALLWFHGAHALDIPGGKIIEDFSISFEEADGGSVSQKDVRNIGGSLLSLLRLIVSGIALIYIIIIGVYFVAFSDDEETIRKQKKQILYAFMGFLFLNVPFLAYDIFMPSGSKDITHPGNLNNQDSMIVLWQSDTLYKFLNPISEFLKVFIFSIAVIMFTWGAFEIMLSSGDPEKKKLGQNRIVYGTLGLIFVGFASGWTYWMANQGEGGFVKSVEDVFGRVTVIVLYFVAPLVIFFLILGAYYYIFSGGSEERIKKGKTIVVNTLIALVLLIASFAMLSELFGSPHWQS